MPVATVKYDLEKVRLACLELMGWTRNPDYAGFEKFSSDTEWLSPLGHCRLCPDPTSYVDDAIPLMKKYHISAGFTGNVPEAVSDTHCIMGTETVALAACLCALRCAGRDLKEFELP